MTVRLTHTHTHTRAHTHTQPRASLRTLARGRLSVGGGVLALLLSPDSLQVGVSPAPLLPPLVLSLHALSANDAINMSLKARRHARAQTHDFINICVHTRAHINICSDQRMIGCFQEDN